MLLLRGKSTYPGRSDFRSHLYLDAHLPFSGLICLLTKVMEGAAAMGTDGCGREVAPPGLVVDQVEPGFPKWAAVFTPAIALFLSSFSELGGMRATFHGSPIGCGVSG